VVVVVGGIIVVVVGGIVVVVVLVVVVTGNFTEIGFLTLELLELPILEEQEEIRNTKTSNINMTVMFLADLSNSFSFHT